MSDGFYRALEERFRGPRDEIRERLRVYLPFLGPLAAAVPGARGLDLGCGRGEFLEVMREAGMAARGVDLDPGMLQACHELGLDVERIDALSALRAQGDQSLAVVSAMHLVEHLPFDDVLAVAREALRVLVPGGVLILETPNPENVVVGTMDFYLDPTHVHPLPPRLLAFVPEHLGFARTTVLRLQQPEWLDTKAPALVSVLRDMSPDYAVVTQKGGAAPLQEALAPAFERELGITLEGLATSYDARVADIRSLAAHALELATQARQDAQGAVARVAEALALAQTAQAQLRAIVESRSWKLTAPLRKVIDVLARLGGK